MKIKQQLSYSVLLALFSHFPFTIFAQEKKDISSNKYNIYENNEIDIAIKDRNVTFVDSLYKITDFYKNGKLANVGFSKEPPFGFFYKREGNFKSYFTNGNLREDANFKNDEYIGVRTEYFEEGMLYKKTQHKTNGELNTITVDEVWDFKGNQLVKNGFGKSKEFSEFHEAIEEGIYKNGLRDSIWTGCYESGKICYTEIYKEGKLIQGNSFDTDGKAYAYNEILEQPEFKGGVSEFYSFLSQNLVYPRKALRAGISGEIFIKFIIEKDGSIVDAYPLKRVHPKLDEEALRVIKLSNGFWTAGKNRALPVRVYFTIPIIFSLE